MVHCKRQRTLAFSIFIIVCLDVGLLMLIQPRVHSYFLLCRFMLLIKFGQFWAVSFSNMIFCSFLFFWLSHYAYVSKLNDVPHFFNLQFPVLDLCTLNKVTQGQSGSPCSECSAPHIETLQYDWDCADESLWPGHTHQEFSLCNWNYSDENCWWYFSYMEEIIHFDWEHEENPVFLMHLPRACVMLSYEGQGDSGSYFKYHRFSLFLSSFSRF